MNRPDSLFDSLVVVCQPHDVILTKIIAKLHFNNFEWTITAIAQTVICFERDMNVLALTQLQFLRATHDVCYAFHHDPVKGVADVVCGAEELQLRQGEHIHIPLETNHRLSNSGDGPLKIIEVQLGDYLGEDDIVRLADDYQRIE